MTILNIPAILEIPVTKEEIMEITKLTMRVTQSIILILSGIRSNMKNIHVADKINVEIMPRTILMVRKSNPKPKPNVIKKTF